MNIGTFNFDADNASVIDKSAYQLSSGDKIIKVKFDTGFVMVYTQTSTGYKQMDFSHQLVKDSRGFYHADMSHIKKDFHDYFPH